MATVLFVDDELVPGDTEPAGNYMWYYTSACRECGFDVLEANGMDEGLATIRSADSIDAVVIDALMPLGEDFPKDVQSAFEAGYLLAKQLLRERPGMPAILLTNANAVSPIKKLRQLKNVRHILFKDQTPPDHLVATLTDMLGSPSSHKLSPKSNPDDWRSLIHGRKLAAFDKFLSSPSDLTHAEFLLLSDLNHGLIQRLISVVPAADSRTTAWNGYTNPQLLSAVSHQEDSKLKGEILEELMLRLFNSIPGFEAKTRVHTETEEIDLFILNGSNDAPWRDMGPALLGECKNWSSKCGVPEYTHFESKVRSRYGQCKCGFFVSWNGFAQTFTDQRLRASREGLLIVEIEGSHAEDAVLNDSFDTVLKRLWESAVTT
jgi:CheY-like chemotaxis protein